MAPRGSPWQEDVTEAQEGKTTCSRPLWGTLCAAGFGSAPILTSSGTGTQMCCSPSERAKQIVTFQSEGSFFFFFFNMTGNKLMAERIRGYGGEEQSTMDLFNMSDRRERTWDHCRGLLLHFGEFFPLTQKLAPLNPKRGFMQEEFQPVLWPEVKNDLSVLWFLTKRTLVGPLFYIISGLINTFSPLFLK